MGFYCDISGHAKFHSPCPKWHRGFRGRGGTDLRRIRLLAPGVGSYPSVENIAKIYSVEGYKYEKYTVNLRTLKGRWERTGSKFIIFVPF